MTTPRGYTAGGVYTGVKTYGPEPRLDLGLLVSDRPAAVAGVFTRSRIPGAPVIVSREHIADGRARALVVNSGCSNVAMGERGLQDARRMCALAAAKVGVEAGEVLVGSTGVIGRPLPMAAIEQGVAQIELSGAGGGAFARAMMTTDTVPKARALAAEIGGRTIHVGGAVKGSGMAHPDMATVFGFLTTDAPLAAHDLQSMLKRIADVSLNMVDIDMDTSTSDTMLLLANGAAGGSPWSGESPEGRAVEQMLTTLAIELARDLARDGEGARTLIQAVVAGARDQADARLAARTIVSSPLVKTMITGRDPNLGRVMMALGRSGAEVQVERITLHIGDQCAFRAGVPTDVDMSTLSVAMDAPEVTIQADLGLGSATATAWGCDLTEDYVRINADYTT